MHALIFIYLQTPSLLPEQAHILALKLLQHEITAGNES